MNPFSTILTERLSIRKLELTDSAVFFAYRSLPEVYEYQMFRPEKIADAEDFISMIPEFPDVPNSWFQLAVCRKENGQLIGDIGLHFLEGGEQVEVGYTIAPEFQGLGYAREALREITNYVFLNLHKHRMIASVDPENLKSIILLNRLGMRKEAHFIKSVRIGDRWVDECVYAILSEEWTQS